MCFSHPKSSLYLPLLPGITLFDTSNAEQFGKTYDDELHRVIIHGILHLCGINDKGPGEREIMEENENKALALLEGASILK